LQDLVNKTMWKKCCFSGDGEYVCAGSARQHALYIWERATGTLTKILHGTKGEILLDVVVRLVTSSFFDFFFQFSHFNFLFLIFSFFQWHPVRPIVASISQGVVTVWAQQQGRNSPISPDIFSQYGCKFCKKYF
jgi:COMPASS component SWD1